MALIKDHWFNGLLLFLAMSVISEIPYFHGQPMLSSATGGTLGTQIEHDLQDSLDTLKSSSSLRDWRASGFTPNDILNSTLALKRKEARDSFCLALKNLSPENLAGFEAALSKPQAGRHLDCDKDLLQKIRNYWAAQTETADAARTNAEAGALPSGAKKLKAETVREIIPDLLENGEYALVFEGPMDPLVTRELLKTLDERAVRATFLMPGNSARENPAMVQMIARAGHALGSQSTEGREMTLVPIHDAERSIVDGAHSLDVAGHLHTALFSFPFGAATDTLENQVLRHGLKPVRADLDSEDWKLLSPARLIESVRGKLGHSSKGILVFHHLRQTAIALPSILDELAANHRKVVIFDIQ